jgi:hypothetical protein
MPVKLPAKAKPTLPRTPEQCREDLEHLRGELKRGEITSAHFNLVSARLVHHLERLMRAKRRYALT